MFVLPEQKEIYSVVLSVVARFDEGNVVSTEEKIITRYTFFITPDTLYLSYRQKIVIPFLYRPAR